MKEFGRRNLGETAAEIRNATNKNRLANTVLIGFNGSLAPTHIELWSRGEVGKSVLLGIAETAVSIPIARYAKKQREAAETARQEFAKGVDEVQGELGDIKGDLALFRHNERERTEELIAIQNAFDVFYDSLPEEVKRQVEERVTRSETEKKPDTED